MLSPLVRSKAAYCAIAAGLLTAAACWAWLPPVPRSRLALPPAPPANYDGDVAVFWGFVGFSADFRYAIAVPDRAPTVPTVWDVANSQLLFSLPEYDRFREWGISPNNDWVVELYDGRTKYWKLPSGEAWEPESAATFPPDREREVRSRLTCDARGQLLVEVSENSDKVIRNLFTGTELGRIRSAKEYLYCDCDLFGVVNLFRVNQTKEYEPGWATTKFDSRLEVHALPGGQLRGVVYDEGNTVSVPLTAGIPTGIPISFASQQNWALTPDCTTLVRETNATVRIWDVPTGKKRTVDLRGQRTVPVGSREITISPDGRFLAAPARPADSSHPWISWFLKLFGGTRRIELAIYDLATGAHVASFREGDDIRSIRAWPWPWFSLDNRSFAVLEERTVYIYDLPFRRPWARTAFAALTVALAVWLMGCYLARRSKLRRPGHGTNLASS